MPPTNRKKLGPALLCGLMIGPILGSGIIILPPMVYGVAGEWALPAWALTIGVSFFFAFLFGFLSILFPGDGGVSGAVAHAFGERVKLLTSLYLIGAVLFGPVAVLLTAGEYLNPVTGWPPVAVAMGVLLFSVALMLRQVASVGQVAFVLTTASAATLLCGGALTLLFHRSPPAPLPPFSPQPFGYALLLLFWTVVGWEVVGNYSADVEDPKRTIPRAILASAGVIALVDLVVAAAVQWADAGPGISVTRLIVPLFGNKAPLVMGLLTLSLCTTTYLLFAGGVARLMASLAEEAALPRLLGRRNGNNAPGVAILLLFFAHATVLLLVARGVFDLEKLVALADAFFIANATIGILAASKLLRNPLLKGCAAALALFFLGILYFSSKLALAVIALMAFVVLHRKLPGIHPASSGHSR